MSSLYFDGSQIINYHIFVNLFIYHKNKKFYIYNIKKLIIGDNNNDFIKLKIQFQVVMCFINVSLITTTIIIINVYIYICMFYINFGFRFFDAVHFTNFAPERHDAQFDHLSSRQ